MKSLFLSNAGNLVALTIIFLSTFVILKLLVSFKLIKNERIKSLLTYILEKRFKWRLFFAMAYFLYAQVLFAALIQIFTWEFGSAASFLSYILAFISIAFGFLLPIGMYKLISKNREKVLNDSLDSQFTLQYGIAWQDLKKPGKNGSERTILFYFFLLLRRSFYACIVVFFQFNANLQIALLNICNVTIIFVVMFQMPFIKRRKNYKIIISEFILVGEYMVIQSYQDEQEDEETRISRGWIIVFATTLIIFIQIFFLCFDILEPIILYLKEKYEQLQVTKTQRRESKSLSHKSEKEKLTIIVNNENNKIKSQSAYNESSFINLHENQQQDSTRIALKLSNLNKNNSSPKIIASPLSKRTKEQMVSRGKKNRLSIDTTSNNSKNDLILNKLNAKHSESFSQIIQHSSNYINTPITATANQSEIYNNNTQKNFESSKSLKLRSGSNTHLPNNLNSNFSTLQVLDQLDENEQVDDYNNIESGQGHDTQAQSQENTAIKTSAKKTFKHQKSNNSSQSSSFQQLDGSYYISQNQFQDQISTRISNRQTTNNSNIIIQQKLSYEEDNSLNKSASPRKNSYSFQGIRVKSDSEIPQIRRSSSRNLSLKTQHQFLTPEPIRRNTTEENFEEENDQQDQKPRFFANQFISKSNQTIQEQPGEENGSIMGISQNQIKSIQDSPIDIAMLQQNKNKMFPLLRNLPRHQSRLIQREFTNIEEENEESNQNSNSIILNDGQSPRDIQNSNENNSKNKSIAETIKKYGLSTPEDTQNSSNNSKDNESPRTAFIRANERKKSQFAKYNSETNLQEDQNQILKTPQKNTQEEYSINGQPLSHSQQILSDDLEDPKQNIQKTQP